MPLKTPFPMISNVQRTRRPSANFSGFPNWAVSGSSSRISRIGDFGTLLQKKIKIMHNNWELRIWERKIIDLNILQISLNQLPSQVYLGLLFYVLKFSILNYYALFLFFFAVMYQNLLFAKFSNWNLKQLNLENPKNWPMVDVSVVH
jgi:hypothetical protein